MNNYLTQNMILLAIVVVITIAFVGLNYWGDSIIKKETNKNINA